MAWRYLLLPLAPLYRGAVAARTAAYRRGLVARQRLEVPVVSVGNLSFGGTGKTPTVIALVRDLVRIGRRPAVLTRGWGRRDDRPQVLVGPETQRRADEVGDEPLEMAHRLPGVPIVVDADRARGGREAQRRGADLVVLDDGFQHLALARDLDLVLLDAADPWAGGRLPPLGRLREPLAALARADAVLVTKLPEDWRPPAAAIERRLAAIAPHLPVLASRLRAERLRAPGGEWRPAGELAGRRVFAFAGLGRPAGFAATLAELGAELAGTRWFADHHRYSERELAAVLEEAAAVGAAPVTTAKDAVKLPPTAPVWVLETVVEPLTGSWRELWRLLPELGA
jgi:tetraacyldisaccharide 4'-kinase